MILTDKQYWKSHQNNIHCTAKCAVFYIFAVSMWRIHQIILFKLRSEVKFVPSIFLSKKIIPLNALRSVFVKSNCQWLHRFSGVRKVLVRANISKVTGNSKTKFWQLYMYLDMYQRILFLYTFTTFTTLQVRHQDDAL